MGTQNHRPCPARRPRSVATATSGRRAVSTGRTKRCRTMTYRRPQPTPFTGPSMGASRPITAAEIRREVYGIDLGQQGWRGAEEQASSSGVSSACPRARAFSTSPVDRLDRRSTSSPGSLPPDRNRRRRGCDRPSESGCRVARSWRISYRNLTRLQPALAVLRGFLRRHCVHRRDPASDRSFHRPRGLGARAAARRPAGFHGRCRNHRGGHQGGT